MHSANSTALCVVGWSEQNFWILGFRSEGLSGLVRNLRFRMAAAVAPAKGFP